MSSTSVSSKTRLAKNQPNRRLRTMMTDQDNYTTIAGLLILAEAILCLMIIRLIRCEHWNEILPSSASSKVKDSRRGAYMERVSARVNCANLTLSRSRSVAKLLNHACKAQFDSTLTLQAPRRYGNRLFNVHAAGATIH